MLLAKIMAEKIDFQELGRTIGNNHKNYYISLDPSKNPNWSLLEKESVDSKQRQVEIEQVNDKSFEDFVKEYSNE